MSAGGLGDTGGGRGDMSDNVDASGGGGQQGRVAEVLREARRVISARTHYEVLGVGAAATQEEVEEAYRRLTRLLHPDLYPDPAVKGMMDAVFLKVNEAHAVLSDPSKRAAYDESLRPPSASTSTSSPTSSSGTQASPDSSTAEGATGAADTTTSSSSSSSGGEAEGGGGVGGAEEVTYNGMFYDAWRDEEEAWRDAGRQGEEWGNWGVADSIPENLSDPVYIEGSAPRCPYCRKKGLIHYHVNRRGDGRMDYIKVRGFGVMLKKYPAALVAGVIITFLSLIPIYIFFLGLYEYASAVHFNFSAQLTGDPNLGWAFNQDTSEFFQGGVWADALLALPLGILVIAASNYVPTAKTLEYVQFPLYLATLFLAASIFKPIALNILMYHGSDLYGPMLYSIFGLVATAAFAGDDDRGDASAWFFVALFTLPEAVWFATWYLFPFHLNLEAFTG